MIARSSCSCAVILESGLPLRTMSGRESRSEEKLRLKEKVLISDAVAWRGAPGCGVFLLERLAFAAGPLMKSFWDALPPTRRGSYAETADALAPLIVQAIEPGDVVMVKGSNGSKAGAIAAALRALEPSEAR